MKSKESKELKVIDIFSGAGGFSLGFEQAGYKIVDNAENDKYALETFFHNFKKTLKNGYEEIDLSNAKDLKKFVERNKDQNIDVLIGGFPCQGYSLIGKRDPNDKRNQLYIPTLKIINKVNPKIFVLENVPGILSMNNGNDVKKIMQKLKKEGWKVRYEIIDSSKFGAPQIRKRIFFIGTKNIKINIDKIWEELMNVEETPKSVGDAINDLSKKQTNAEINHVIANHSAEIIKRMENLREGEPLYPKFQGGTKKLIWGMPSPTIRDNHGGTFIHPKENRYLTAREIARLQSFPDTFIFKGPKTKQLKQIGNAVSVDVSNKIAEKIKRWL